MSSYYQLTPMNYITKCKSELNQVLIVEIVDSFPLYTGQLKSRAPDPRAYAGIMHHLHC